MTVHRPHSHGNGHLPAAEGRHHLSPERGHTRPASVAGRASYSVLIAVLALAVVSALMAMQHVTTSSQMSKRIKEAIYFPTTRYSDTWDMSDGSDDGEELDVPAYSGADGEGEDADAPLQPIDKQPNGNREESSSVSGDEREQGGAEAAPIILEPSAGSEGAGASTPNAQYEEKGEAQSGKDVFTADRRDFNNNIAKETPSPSLRKRETPFPRITTIDGDTSVLSSNLEMESEDKPRKIEVSKIALKQQKRLKDSDDFSYRDPLYEGECVPMQPWQETSFPNCNLFHELDFAGKSTTDEFEFYAKGGYNQIWWINEKDKNYDPEMVVKILKWGTTYSDRNFDRVRRDGLILERLTKSRYVLDTYGFCGFDVLTPYASGGTLSSFLRLWERGKVKLTPKKRLQYATEVAEGLAAVHDIDGEGLSSVAHGDLKGGHLGTSTGAAFLRRNSTAPETACTYTIGKNDAAFRSPEEYEYLPQTSAINVYALGSILYEILTGREVWYDTDTKKAQRYIRKGDLPEIPEEIVKSKDPVDVALKQAIDMCYVFDPKKRAKAAEVAQHLQKALIKIK
ncbi:hypothetical protein ACHAXT_010452 [Thalassiosira profunda]